MGEGVGLAKNRTRGRLVPLSSVPALWLRCVFGLALLFVLLIPVCSWAHGFAGKRFFPTTLAVDDPFVSDEFSLLFGHIKEAGQGEEPPTRTTEVSYEWAKRITPHLGLSIGQAYRFLNPDEGGSTSGFTNLELGLKYQFYTNDTHETILSLGVGAEIGGTGASRVGADSFSTISPALFFGKGMGDLPESMNYLKPLAVTGVLGVNFPTRSSNVTVNADTGESDVELNPKTLSWGFTLQYSLQYLQSFVKDVGLGDPFKRMIVLVEFPLETCISSGCGGRTTGTINPGLVWFGKSFQLGIEAQFPVNRRSGKTVGVLGIIHFFLDDLFPKSIGRPLFP